MNTMVCRLCGKSDRNLLDVFLDQDTNLTLKVYQCFGVWISKEDPITKSICRSCYFFTNSAYEHRIHSLGHDAKLKRENLIAQINFPTNVSQRDFLIHFDLADKKHFDKIVKSRTVMHPSVRKLKRKFPYIIIPSSCMKINIDPLVVILPPVAKKSKVDVTKWYCKRPDYKTPQRKNLLPIGRLRNRTLRPPVSVVEKLPSLRNRVLRPTVPVTESLPGPSNRPLRLPVLVNESLPAPSNRTLRSPVSVTESLPGPSNRPLRLPVLVNESLYGPSNRTLSSPVSVTESLPGSSNHSLEPPVLVAEILPVNRNLRSKVPANKKEIQLDMGVKENLVNHPSTTILKDRCVLKVLLERDDSLLQFLTTPYTTSKPDAPSSKASDGLDLLTLSDEVATYICQTCNKVFDSKKLLWSHKKHHHKSSLRCGRCSKKFSVVEQLMLHMASHKPLPVVPEKVRVATPDNYSNKSVDEVSAPSSSEDTKNIAKDEVYHIVKSSNVTNSFKIVKSSTTVVKDSESLEFTKRINNNLKQAFGTALLDLDEVIKTSKTQNASSEESNVVPSDTPFNVENDNNVARDDVPPNITEDSNIYTSGVFADDNTEESNKTTSEAPPNDDLDEIDVPTHDVCVISDSDSEDCSIVAVTPGSSKLSIDNVLLFALTPQSKPNSLKKTACAEGTILPTENATVLQKNEVLEPNVSLTNIPETDITENRNSEQDHQSAPKTSDQTYTIIYENTSDNVEDVYLTNSIPNCSSSSLDEREKTLNQNHSITCITNPVTTNVSGVNIFASGVPIVADEPFRQEQLVKQSVPELSFQKNFMKDGTTNVDPLHVQNQPSTSEASSNILVISDDDSGSGDTSKDTEIDANVLETLNEKDEVVIPAVFTTVDKQADNNSLAIAANEKNFVKYILNKCCVPENPTDSKSNKRFIRNIRMYGKKFIIPIQVVQARTNCMKMSFLNNTAGAPKISKKKNLWDPQDAICAKRTQDPFYSDMIQQTPSTSNVNPQPQLTINVYDSPGKTTINSQKPIVINGLSYPTVNMAKQSPAILPNKSLPYMLPKHTETNCEKSGYLLDTMQMTQPPQNLNIHNIINIDFQDNVDIPVHIIQKDVKEIPISNQCQNTVEMPSDQTQQHRPIIRLKHISELMG